MSGRYCVIELSIVDGFKPNRFPYYGQWFPWYQLCNALRDRYGLHLPPLESLTWVPDCFLPAHLVDQIDQRKIEFAPILNAAGDFVCYLIRLE